MHELQLNQIKKLSTFLDNVGAKYKIILPDGVELGTLEVRPVKERARNFAYAPGETRSYYKPLFDAANMQPGDVIDVPFDRFDPRVLASNVAAYAHGLWGVGGSVSKRNDKKGVVEIMRVL